MRALAAITGVLVLALLVGGCDNSARRTEQESLRVAMDQARQLRQQNADQLRRIDQLQGQLEVLRGFGPERLEKFVTVARISLGRYTRTYDADEDGVDDGIKVYLLLEDGSGDTIKASGEIEIDVLDLAAQAGQRDIGHWDYSLDESAAHWLDGFGTNYFKFELPWPDGHTPAHANLTVVTRFNDALTGRAFETQKVVTTKPLPD